MKKALSVLFVFAMIAGHAQESKFSLGFTFNPNVGWISSEDLNINDDIEVSSSGARLGFSYGLIGEYHFTENYHIALGINHLFTGGNFTGTNTGELSTPTTASPKSYSSIAYEPAGLRYIHIPALLRLKTNEIGYIRYFGNIGFAFDFALNGNADVTVTGQELVSDNQVEDFNESYNDIRYDSRFLNSYFVVGLGGQYSLGGNTLVHFGIDYNSGLSNAIGNREKTKYSENIFEDAQFRNSYVSINLGIFL